VGEAALRAGVVVSVRLAVPLLQSVSLHAVGLLLPRFGLVV